MKPDLDLPPNDDSVDVTSRPRTLVCVDVVDVASCRLRHEHLPEINRLGKHQRFI